MRLTSMLQLGEWILLSLIGVEQQADQMCGFVSSFELIQRIHHRFGDRMTVGDMTADVWVPGYQKWQTRVFVMGQVLAEDGLVACEGEHWVLNAAGLAELRRRGLAMERIWLLEPAAARPSARRLPRPRSEPPAAT